MTLGSDRGEGPVPYIIIVAIMALAAVAIATGVWQVAEGWLDDLGAVEGP
jgi:hypothetical protein